MISLIMVVAKLTYQVRIWFTYLTGPEENQSYLHNSYYDIYFFFCVCYTNSVSFIKFLRKFCVYDESCFKNTLLGKKST